MQAVHRLARARCGGSAPSAAARRASPGCPAWTAGRRASATAARRASSSTQDASRPSSSQVPSTSTPPGASAAGIVAQAGVDLALVVLPQHVERPHHRRAQPGQLEPAARERQPGRVGGRRGGGDPGRVDLRRRRPGRPAGPAASRARSSTAVTGVAPYPRSTTSGSAASPAAGRRRCTAIQLSTRRSRLGLVVPRVTTPRGRSAPSELGRQPGAPCAGRPGRAGGPPAGRC